MATWKNLELGQLLTVVQEVADKAAVPLEAAATLAETAANLAKLLATLLPGANPLGPLVDALLNAVLQNDVSVLPVLPEWDERRRGWGGFMGILRDSVNDTGDPRRPKYEPIAGVGGLVVLGHAESFDVIRELMEVLELLTDIRLPDFPVADMLPAPRGIIQSGVVTQDKPPPTPTTFQDGSMRNLPPVFVGKSIEFQTGPAAGGRRRCVAFNPATGYFTVDPGFPAAPKKFDAYLVVDLPFASNPDWTRVRLADLSRPVRRAVVGVRRLARSLQVPGPGPELVRAIQARAQQLALVASRLAELAEILANLPTDGASLVSVPFLPGGIDGFLSRLDAAENRPPVSGSDYVCGVVLLYGSAAVGTALSFVAG